MFLLNPSSGEYALTYLKSNAEVVFSYVTDTAENLNADWEISGPTDWQGNSMMASRNRSH